MVRWSSMRVDITNIKALYFIISHKIEKSYLLEEQFSMVLTPPSMTIIDWIMSLKLE
jgi:hypothetical protein